MLRFIGLGTAFVVGLSISLWISMDRCAAEEVNTNGNQSSITFTLLECEPAVSELPRMTIVDVTSGYGSLQSVNPTLVSESRSAMTIKTQLLPGTFEVSLTQGNCNAKFDVTVLPGRDRHIAVALRRRVFIDYHLHNSVSGLLPYSGISVKLWYCGIDACDLKTRRGFRSTEADVDGDAYYVNQLVPGPWYLEVVFVASDSRIVVPITEAEDARLRYKHVQLNLSSDELQRLWGLQNGIRPFN